MDEMHMNLPRMAKDMYWNDCEARPPYTLAAADYCIPSFLGSTTDMGSAHTNTPLTHTTQSFQSLQLFPTGCVRRGLGLKRSSLPSFRLSDILQCDEPEVTDTRRRQLDPVLFLRRESVIT